MNRPLAAEEAQLIRWMLRNAEPDATAFLPQLEKAQATPWRCPCGCASVNLSIDGAAWRPGSSHIVADFVFGEDASLSGVFVFARGGLLSGIEVYGLAGDAPRLLPSPEALRPFPK